MKLLIAIAKDLQIPIETFETIYNSLGEDKKNDLELFSNFNNIISKNDNNNSSEFSSFYNSLISIIEKGDETYDIIEYWTKEENVYLLKKLNMIVDFKNNISDIELNRVVQYVIDIVDKEIYPFIQNKTEPSSEYPNAYVMSNNNEVIFKDIFNKFKNAYNEMLDVFKKSYNISKKS